VAAFITYGRLGDTLRTSGRAVAIRVAADADDDGSGGGGGDMGMRDDQLVSVLGDEPLGVSEDTLDVVEALAELRMAQIRRESCDNDTFVMGDFWPGNVLVCDEDEKKGDSAVDGGRLMVVDWEIARPGMAGMDVGRFCAEFATVRQLWPERAEAAGEILKHFVRAYFAGDVGSSEVEETWRVALSQFGVHLAVWTPKTGWNAETEATREAVLNGVERLVQGADAERIWTDEELVQIFMC
jgi:Phosphotransferase enzyme family